MSKGFISAFRLGIVCVGVLAGFAGIGTRLVHLQVVQRDDLLRQVEQVVEAVLPPLVARVRLHRGNELPLVVSYDVLPNDETQRRGLSASAEAPGWASFLRRPRCFSKNVNRLGK